jgi:xanthine dehydrogenase YagS FAD-binding subunit
MKAFQYQTAGSEDGAVKLLGEDAVLLAGGTSLLNLLKNYVLEPERVVHVGGIESLGSIELDENGARIGAGVKISDILENETIAKNYPALVQALQRIGSPQIRNMATLGGNLCARTPCWYGNHKLLHDADTDAVRNGDNEYHAIFGNDSIVTVHASSAAPALVALGARIRIAGEGGARELPLDDFFVTPQTPYASENVLKPNELVTHVVLGPAQPHSASYEVRHKDSHDWPLSLASVALQMDGKKCTAAKICLGAVAPVPWRAAEAEKLIAGAEITEETAAKAADAAVAGATPLSGNAYKVRTARACVRRAVLVAALGSWM